MHQQSVLTGLLALAEGTPISPHLLLCVHTKMQSKVCVIKPAAIRRQVTLIYLFLRFLKLNALAAKVKTIDT